VQYSFTYDIIEDGDNYLKGKITELVFERVRSKLLRKITHCCGVTELKHFLTAYPPEARSMNVNSLLKNYAEKLNSVRSLLGLKEIDDFNALLKDARGRLLGSCLFCLRKGRVPIIIEKGDPEKGVLRRCFRVCRECFSKCIEKGLLREVSYSIGHPSASEPMKKVWCYFVDEGILSREKKKFYELVWSLLKDLDLLRYMEVVEVLSKLDEKSRDFLVELYERREPGQNPFDYICVDDERGKYLVDVTSVKGIGEPSPLSEREK
jgi:hypothetical protein